MDSKWFDDELMYIATMNIAKRMLNQGLMTKEQFEHIDTIFIKKYRPFLEGIYSDLT